MDITTTAAITVLAGLASTILTAVVKNPAWDTGKKRAASLAVAAGLGLIAAITTRAITPPADANWPWWQAVTNWLTWVVSVLAVVVTVSQGVYQQLKTPLDGLSKATSPTSTTSPQTGDETQHAT